MAGHIIEIGVVYAILQMVWYVLLIVGWVSGASCVVRCIEEQVVV